MINPNTISRLMGLYIYIYIYFNTNVQSNFRISIYLELIRHTALKNKQTQPKQNNMS